MLQYAYGKTMPKILTIISIGIIGLSACQTRKAAPEVIQADGPAIWKVQDEDTTLYLYGYAPVLKTGSEWQTETFTAAFEAADLVVLEADNSSPEAQKELQALIPTLGLNSDGKTLNSILNEEQRAEVGAVSASLGAPLPALDALKPWLASVQLGVLALSSSGEYDLAGTPATVLVTRAIDAKKKMQTLENPAQVMEIMAGFAVEEQVGMLVHTARTLRDDPQQQSVLADAWLKGDVKTIGDILHGQDGAWSSDVIYDAMLVNRNTAWTEDIIRLMDRHEGTIFLAVGFGHLAGEDSLIEMLSDAGYTSRRQ